jgi:hypothetical protein
MTSAVSTPAVFVLRDWPGAVGLAPRGNPGIDHRSGDNPAQVSFWAGGPVISRDRGAVERAIEDLLSQSHGVDGGVGLSRDTQRWLAGLTPQLPKRFWVHDDAASRRAAGLLGARGFVRHNRIFLGPVPAEQREAVLRHELVHLAQVQVALRTGHISSLFSIEQEADAISSLPAARPVRCGASPHLTYAFIWFVAIGVGLYVLLRPGVANAPGPRDRTFRSPSMGQITAEALCLFAVPGGAFALGGRIGLGFLSASAFAGAATNVGLRVVGDVSRGEASSPLMYVFDAGTGAVIGFVVPGGLRLVGQAGTYALDRLATYGLRNADIALAKVLAEQAARTPLTAVEAQQILQSRGLAGQVSQWWLDRRGLILLYRGQEIATGQILSPLARQENIAASEALVARLRSLGMGYEEIAGYTARWHTEPVPPFLAPPGFGGFPLGSVGIPTTRIPGIAANFGEGGVIYIIRVPSNLAIRPLGWQGLLGESEYVILNQVPPGAIVQAIPASRVAPLMVDANGLLVPGQ